MSSSTSSTRGQQQQDEQQQTTMRSIDETKGNIHKALDEVRRETPRYAQSITDFQNETADATREIADDFLESQKEVISSMQSAWGPMMQNMQGGSGQSAGMMGGGGTMFFLSPQQIADIYERTIGAFTEAYVASARMATNLLFAGLEATRATTNYTKQNAKEACRITSNTAKAFSQTARETVQSQGRGGEGQQRGGGRSSGSGGSERAGGSTSGSSESKGAAVSTTTTSYTIEGTTPASSSGTGSATGTVSLSDTVPAITEKERKKF